MKKPRRLPKEFQRPVSLKMRELASRRYGKKTRSKKKQNIRWWRGLYQKWLHAVKVFVTMLPALIMMGILLFGGVVFFSPWLTIDSISIVTQENRLASKDVQPAVQQYIGEHLLFTQSREIKQNIQVMFPDITTIVVEKSYPNHLQITLELEELVAEVLFEDGQGASTGKLLWITESGYITEAVSASGTALPKITLTDWGVRPQPVEQIMSIELLETLSNAVAQLESQFSQVVQQRTVYLRAKEIHLTLDTYDLWIDLTTPLDDQLRRYRVLLANVNPEEITQYVDLRISDRVIYR
jgi:cell division septal protein FtsQ